MDPTTGFRAQLIKTSQAAELLGVSTRSVENWIKQDKIPYVKLPGGGKRPSYRIPLGGLLESLSGTYDLAGHLEQLEQRAAEAGLTEAEIAKRMGERSKDSG